MQIKDFSKEEYNNLYRELHANSNRIAVSINIVYTATSGLILYGLKAGEESPDLIFLTPMLLIIPLTFFIHSQMDGIARIATYLRVFFEGKETGLHWENRVSRLKSFKEFRGSKFVRSLQSIFGGVALICFGLTIYRLWDGGFVGKEVDWSILVVSFFAVLYSLGLVRAARKKYPAKYMEYWQNIKGLEDEENEPPIDDAGPDPEGD